MINKKIVMLRKIISLRLMIIPNINKKYKINLKLIFWTIFYICNTNLNINLSLLINVKNKIK